MLWSWPSRTNGKRSCGCQRSGKANSEVHGLDRQQTSWMEGGGSLQRRKIGKKLLMVVAQEFLSGGEASAWWLDASKCGL
jgi:hypothetical protein